MRALIQRVSRASVTIDREVFGRIEGGLVVLLGISRESSDEDARYIVRKTVNLRIFADEKANFNCSALDVGAELLLVSQFTLYGSTRSGRRPSFIHAASPEQAETLFNRTVGMFRESGLVVQTGKFRAHMMVSIDNDGPVTIMLDSAERKGPRMA